MIKTLLPAAIITALQIACGQSLAGAVYAPVLGELFSAAHGLGASLNGEPIAVSPRRGLQDSLVNAWLGVDDDDRQVARMAEIQRQTFSLRSFGGSALVLAYVACGRFDIYYAGDNPRMGPWDIAAGPLLVTEAGATSIATAIAEVETLPCVSPNR